MTRWRSGCSSHGIQMAVGSPWMSRSSCSDSVTSGRRRGALLPGPPRRARGRCRDRPGSPRTSRARRPGRAAPPRRRHGSPPPWMPAAAVVVPGVRVVGDDPLGRLRGLAEEPPVPPYLREPRVGAFEVLEHGRPSITTRWVTSDGWSIAVRKATRAPRSWPTTANRSWPSRAISSTTSQAMRACSTGHGQGRRAATSTRRTRGGPGTPRRARPRPRCHLVPRGVRAGVPVQEDDGGAGATVAHPQGDSPTSTRSSANPSNIGRLQRPFLGDGPEPVGLTRGARRC